MKKFSCCRTRGQQRKILFRCLIVYHRCFILRALERALGATNFLLGPRAQFKTLEEMDLITNLQDLVIIGWLLRSATTESGIFSVEHTRDYGLGVCVVLVVVAERDGCTSILLKHYSQV